MVMAVPDAPEPVLDPPAAGVLPVLLAALLPPLLLHPEIATTAAARIALSARAAVGVLVMCLRSQWVEDGHNLTAYGSWVKKCEQPLSNSDGFVRTLDTLPLA